MRKKDAVLTKCFHVFCFECVKTRYDTRQRKCPKCNAAFGANDFHRIYIGWFFPLVSWKVAAYADHPASLTFCDCHLWGSQCICQLICSLFWEVWLGYGKKWILDPGFFLVPFLLFLPSVFVDSLCLRGHCPSITFTLPSWEHLTEVLPWWDGSCLWCRRDKWGLYLRSLLWMLIIKSHQGMLVFLRVNSFPIKGPNPI